MTVIRMPTDSALADTNAKYMLACAELATAKAKYDKAAKRVARNYQTLFSKDPTAGQQFAEVMDEAQEKYPGAFKW